MRNCTLFLMIVVLLSACSDDDSSAKKARVTVPITMLEVDDTGTPGEEIEIHARATASNGCYSNLEIVWNETDERYFLLTATGTFITQNNICPENIVQKDTIITFTPTLTGLYYFRANQQPHTILYDTLEVE